MDKGKKGPLYVYVVNVNTDKKRLVEKQTFGQADIRTMKILPYLSEKYTNNFTHVAVHIKNSATEDLGPAEGTISLISRSLEHQEKNKKLADKSAKSSEPSPFMSLVFFFGLVIFIIGSFFAWLFVRRR